MHKLSYLAVILGMIKATESSYETLSSFIEEEGSLSLSSEVQWEYDSLLEQFVRIPLLNANPQLLKELKEGEDEKVEELKEEAVEQDDEQVEEDDDEELKEDEQTVEQDVEEKVEEQVQEDEQQPIQNVEELNVQQN